MASQAAHDDDVMPEETQGYKLSQPKQSLAEYQQMAYRMLTEAVNEGSSGLARHGKARTPSKEMSTLHPERHASSFHVQHLTKPPLRSPPPAVTITHAGPVTMPGLLFSDGLAYYHHYQGRSNSPRSSRPNPSRREAIRNRVNPLAPRESLYPGVFPAAPVYPPRIIRLDEILPWDATVIPSSAFERGEIYHQEQQAAAVESAELRAAKRAARKAEKAEKKAEKSRKAQEKALRKEMQRVEKQEQIIAERAVSEMEHVDHQTESQSPAKERIIKKLKSKFFTKDKKSLVEPSSPIHESHIETTSPGLPPADRATSIDYLTQTERRSSVSSIDSSPGLPTDSIPDQGDESLQRYKESLGLGGGGKDLSDPNDPRVCIIESLSMQSPGRGPVTIDLSTPGSEKTLKDKPFKIKEGATFSMTAKFRVQHEILSGLQYVQIVKRKGIRVSKDTEMLGSFAPNTDKTPIYTKTFPEEVAPSGMLLRGTYYAFTSFVDDDKKVHLAFEWSFDIAKDW
ncbi:Putative dioxygenase [Verticillium dahliae VDG2]|nr:Putative dioxygenase [Verticillium dahliae VDG2]